MKFRVSDNPVNVASNFCQIYGLKEGKVMAIATHIDQYLLSNVAGYVPRLSGKGFDYSFEND